MAKIFNSEDKFDMQLAANFAWIDIAWFVDETMLDTSGRFLNRIIDRIKEIDKCS